MTARDGGRVVTFDLWHTLFDEGAAAERRVQRAVLLHQAVRAPGGTPTLEQVRDAFAASTDAMLAARRAADRDPGPRAQAHDFLRRLGMAPDGALLDAILAALAEALAHDPPAPYGGVVETLAALSPQAPLGLISNTGWSGGAALRPLLARQGLAPHLAALAFSDEVGWGKPDARIFAHCFDGLGPARPDQVLHVGDSLRADVAGAKRLGARACWIAPPGESTEAELRAIEPLMRPDLVFPSVAAAREALALWLRGDLFPG